LASATDRGREALEDLVVLGERVAASDVDLAEQSPGDQEALGGEAEEFGEVGTGGALAPPGGRTGGVDQGGAEALGLGIAGGEAVGEVVELE
jgi:hypothetical protein